MEQITVPQALKDPKETPYLVEGPFKATFNGIRSVGMFLDWTGTGYSVFAAGRDFFLDDTYIVHTALDTITFYSEAQGRKFVLQPLTQADVEWIVPDEPELDINDLKEVILNAKRHDFEDGDIV